MKVPAHLSCALGLALLLGCPKDPPPDPVAIQARSLTLSPPDERLADLYAHSCRACHTVATSGAPLTGDRVAWRERWDKGMPTLVANAVQGVKGMPAGGQCVRCTAADLQALITFMADQDSK